MLVLLTILQHWTSFFILSLVSWLGESVANLRTRTANATWSSIYYLWLGLDAWIALRTFTFYFISEHSAVDWFVLLFSFSRSARILWWHSSIFLPNDNAVYVYINLNIAINIHWINMMLNLAMKYPGTVCWQKLQVTGQASFTNLPFITSLQYSVWWRTQE